MMISSNYYQINNDNIFESFAIANTALPSPYSPSAEHFDFYQFGCNLDCDMDGDEENQIPSLCSLLFMEDRLSSSLFDTDTCWEHEINPFSSIVSRTSVQRRMKRKRKRVLNPVQRVEATFREKKRMLKLNWAFEQLRRVLPETSCNGKSKLSRVETLRTAMDYIQTMSAAIFNADLSYP
ncbi:hypothetical protein GJ496_008768 [Pomphorhynchus laevis]|nr:hypothetical protein GJ496_008768 [Pomphorhynchus laevis]